MKHIFQRRWLQFGLGSLMLVVTVSAFAVHIYANRLGELEQVFGTRTVLNTVRYASEAQVYRLGKIPIDDLDRTPADKFPLAAGPIAIDDKTVSRLSRTLTQRATYDWDFDKSCIPAYGVRIRFERALNMVDVYFCFECMILAVFHNGHCVGGGNFDNGNAQLVAIVKRLFPRDRAIQGL